MLSDHERWAGPVAGTAGPWTAVDLDLVAPAGGRRER